jgi:intraflagellar transport protein 81
LEKEIQKREEKIKKERGNNSMANKGDFEQYAANLRNKTAKYKQMKEELKDIKNEVSVLQRTNQILEQKKNQHQ